MAQQFTDDLKEETGAGGPVPVPAPRCWAQDEIGQLSWELYQHIMDAIRYNTEAYDFADVMEHWIKGHKVPWGKVHCCLDRAKYEHSKVLDAAYRITVALRGYNDEEATNG